MPILWSELGLGILHFHQVPQVILMEVFPLTFHFKNSQALGRFQEQYNEHQYTLHQDQGSANAFSKGTLFRHT